MTSNGSGEPGRFEIDLKRQALAVFDTLLDLPASEHEEILTDLRISQPQVASEVEKLIRADRESAVFYESAKASGISITLDPSSIGEYRVERLIGRGAVGRVYLCSQSKPKRQVAIKVLDATLEDKLARTRFEREADLISRLSHPNIGKVHGVEIPEQSAPYIVLEYIQGHPLDAYLPDRRLELHERLELFLQICGAVEHAHQRGVIHRDLKPSNILVSEINGKPHSFVIDFGIASAIESGSLHSKLTHTGALMGTPLYMSPEQLTLVDAPADTRADIYALGLILYESVTGEPAFDLQNHGSTRLVELFERVKGADPPFARSTVASRETNAVPYQVIPPEIDWIIQRACAFDPKDRFQTVGDLAADVRSLLNSEPVSSAPPSLLYRCRTFYRRNRTFSLAVLTILVVLSVSTLVSTIFAIDARSKSRFAVKAQSHLQHELMVSHFRELGLHVEAHEFDAASAALKTLSKYQEKWLWQFYDAIVNSHAAETECLPQPSALSVHPGTKQVALGTLLGEVEVLQGMSGVRAAYKSVYSSRVTHVEWSESGDRLLVVHDKRSWSEYRAGEPDPQRIGAFESDVLDVAFEEDAGWCLVTRRGTKIIGTDAGIAADSSHGSHANQATPLPEIHIDGGLFVVRFPNGRAVEVTKSLRELYLIRCSADRKSVILSYFDGIQQRVSIARSNVTGPQELKVPQESGRVTPLWSNQREYLHLANKNGTVDLYSLQSDRVVATTRFPLDSPSAFSVDLLDGNLYIADVHGQLRKWAAPGAGRCTEVSLDGTPIGLSMNGDAIRVALQDGESVLRMGRLLVDVFSEEKLHSAFYSREQRAWLLATHDGDLSMHGPRGRMNVAVKLPSPLSKAAMSDEPSTIFAAGYGDLVQVTGFAKNQGSQSFSVGSHVIAIASDQNSDRLALSTHDKRVRVTDYEGKVLASLSASTNAFALTFSQSGNTLFVGYDDGSVTEYAITENRVVTTRKPHSETVVELIEIPDHGFISRARGERPVYTQTAGRVFSLPLPNLVSDTSAIRTDERRALLMSNDDGDVTVVDVQPDLK